MNSKHFMLTVAMLVGVLSLLITSISAPFFYWKNSTKKRASRASALRADGVSLRVDF